MCSSDLDGAVEEYSYTVPAGAVVRTEPAAGEAVRAGMTVQIVVSTGEPQAMPVPEVAGTSREDAEAALAAAGLKVGVPISETSMTVPEGHVIRTKPAEGTEVLSGATVRLVVSAGKPQAAVPDVLGMARADAEAALAAAGFATVVSEEADATVAAGTVLRTEPAAGTSVAVGATVTLVVSSGPAGSGDGSGEGAGGEAGQPEGGSGEGSGGGDAAEGGSGDGGATEGGEAAAAALFASFQALPLRSAAPAAASPFAMGSHDEFDGGFTLRTLATVTGDSVDYIPEGGTDPQPSVKPAPPGSRSTVTDSEGIYRFDGLQCFVQKGPDGKLVEYEVRGAADEVIQDRKSVV